VNLLPQGFRLEENAIPQNKILELRNEADRIATNTQSTCVRHLSERSDLFANLVDLFRSQGLIANDHHLVRSILFNKTAAQNWPVAWHQDLSICVTEKIPLDDYGPWSEKDGQIHVQPPVELLSKMITLRVHLDETPASNGALRVIPGSHLLGKIPSDQIIQHTDTPHYTCEAAPGDILLMSPLILHASSRSLSPENRRILHFEFARKNALHPRLNWAAPEFT